MHEEKSTLSLTVFGCRGSMPAADPRMSLFGGNTSCYMVSAGKETLLIDAGSGIAGAVPAEGPVHILFTHFHLDHLLGLPVFPPLLEKGREIHLYGRSREGLSPREQIARLISPPLWPAPLERYPAAVFFHELEFPLRLGAFEADGMETRHPGGSLVLKVSALGKSFVCATDFVHTEGEAARLEGFSRGTDLLLYDAQYTPEEFAARPSFGHSTAEEGIRIGRACGAKRIVMVHHDPSHTDQMLLERERNLGVHFAREGEVFTL